MRWRAARGRREALDWKQRLEKQKAQIQQTAAGRTEGRHISKGN